MAGRMQIDDALQDPPPDPPLSTEHMPKSHLLTHEAWQLVQAFHRIQDPKAQQTVLAIIKALADRCEWDRRQALMIRDV